MAVFLPVFSSLFSSKEEEERDTIIIERKVGKNKPETVQKGNQSKD